MKQILTAVLGLGLAFLLCTCTLVEEPRVDYLEVMAEAAVAGDTVAGKEAEFLRNQRIDAIGAGEKIAFDDLVLLSEFISSQSGTFSDNENYLLCIGEVALNRLASREFPNSLSGVIEQLQQGEADILPSKKSVELALRLLQGERLLAPHVVHFTTEEQSDAYATFCDRRQNFVYFCESEYPRFYHLPNKKSN